MSHSITAGWDCHAHLFGPYAHYPLGADRSYTPPEALQADYLALLQRLGLAHGVLVQPSAYGEDHGLLLDTLAALPQLRGAGGNFAGSASLEDLETMAGALADEGLHAELWTDCQALPDIAPRLRALALPIVIDHMGGFDAAAGVNAPGFRLLLSLLEAGTVWVKLCAYRNVLGDADLERARPFHDLMLAANPEQLVWGSDWPHLRVTPAPDAQQLLQTFARWAGSEALARQVLQDNPARLYA